MLRDVEWVLSDSQAVTTAVATASTNIYDTRGPAPSDLGVGEVLWIVASVGTTVVSGGTTNVTFAIQTDSDIAFGTPVTLFTTAAIAKATLVAGYRIFAIRLPVNCERYIRAVITPDTTAITTGNFDIYLTLNPDLVPALPHPRAVYPVA